MAFPSSSDLLGRVQQLFVYPVKSCAGIALDQAVLTPAGLAGDREYMVVNARGDFLSQRSHPRMALVRPQIDGAGLVLHAPGQPPLAVSGEAAGAPMPVRVWGDTVLGLPMGAAAARWFSALLGETCTLVRFDPSVRRLSSLRWTGGRAAPNLFSDGYPLLVVTEAAQHALNQRLQQAGHAPVGVERFRPNLVVGGWEAHDEDRVAELHIAAEGGAATLALVKPCARCPIPDIDPATAESHPAVGQTLRSYRADARLDGAITFGMNAIVTAGAGLRLRVGQPVAADLDFG